MAKKIKNMKLEQNDLTPTTIGVFENRKRSSVGAIILIIIFVAFVWFLPQISEYINAYLNPTTVTPATPKNPTTPKNPEEVEKPELVPYSDSIKLTNSDLTVDQIVISSEDLTIKYAITNNGTNTDIESLNYYLELYNKEQTFIERIKLATLLTMPTGAFRNVVKTIKEESANSIGYLMLVKKNYVEYPEVSLQNAIDGTGTMVCTRGETEKVTYKFNDNKLVEVVSEVSQVNTIDNYDSLYQEQANLSNTYNNKEGITSTIFSYDTGYHVTTTVNLNDADRTIIYNADTFKLNTEPKVVHFEMSAQGFSCN